MLPKFGADLVQNPKIVGAKFAAKPRFPLPQLPTWDFEISPLAWGWLERKALSMAKYMHITYPVIYYLYFN